MNINKQQSTEIGIFLIALGLVWWLKLWWLVWPGALAVAGVIAYQRRRGAGRTVEAVQAGLWCVGLALLFLLHFIWPGILLLAGLSVLARGHEQRIDTALQQVIAQARQRPSSTRSYTTQQVPITTQQIPGTPQPAALAPTSENPTNAPSTGETTRL